MQGLQHLGETDIPPNQHVNVGVRRLLSPRDRAEHKGELAKDRAIRVGPVVHLITCLLPRQDASPCQLDQFAARAARQGANPAGEFARMPVSIRMQNQGRQHTCAQRPEEEVGEHAMNASQRETSVSI